MVDSALNRLLNLKYAKDWKARAQGKRLHSLAIFDMDDAGLVGPDGLVHEDA